MFSGRMVQNIFMLLVLVMICGRFVICGQFKTFALAESEYGDKETIMVSGSNDLVTRGFMQVCGLAGVVMLLTFFL